MLPFIFEDSDIADFNTSMYFDVCMTRNFGPIKKDETFPYVEFVFDGGIGELNFFNSCGEGAKKLYDIEVTIEPKNI